MTERESLAALWKTRARSFRKETIPYFRYMGQSGFPSFLSLLFIASAIGYFKLIRDLPAHFPIAAVGIVVLTLVMGWSPLRTYLTQADIVYLMPREHGMGEYIRLSYRRSLFFNGLIAAAVLLLYLPIYVQGDANINPWLLALGVTALQFGNAALGWQERKLAWSGRRRINRLLRWMLTAASLAAWLLCVWWQASLFMLLCGLLAYSVNRATKKQAFPWYRLIQEEERIRKAYYVFFGMFIDVPILSATVSRRSYLAWMLPRIGFGRRNTYVYLFAASLFRTEIAGILIRILLLGALVTYWSADALTWDGWAAALVYGLFSSIYSLQLGGLRQVHRFSVWKHVYPLPGDELVRQYIRVDRSALLIGLLPLWLAAAAPMLLHGVFLPALAAIAAALGYAAIRPARMRKKLALEAEEE
ncbi:ABC transporter permease [Paenibacillus sp. HB172176]|uniref:ABC transporter permease n=1 Tax=Paenibacillus sp. HB172176 TaxID=2493690 RepID=UPI0014386F5A|nr:ABC transporter permease [Paenibacillus sp. HB172176]